MSFLIAGNSKANYKKIKLLKKRYKAVFTTYIDKYTAYKKRLLDQIVKNPLTLFNKIIF